MKALKLLLVMGMTFTLTSSSQGPPETEVTSVAWAEAYTFEWTKGSIDFEGYEIVLHHTNGEVIHQSLTLHHFDEAHRFYLNQLGSHQMELSIEGYPLEMVATIIAPSIPGLLDAIYQRGLDEGLTQGKTYQEWLLGIQGTPGRSIIDAHVNEEGLLHLHFCDGDIMPLVNVIGPKGDDASQIEIDIIDQHIQWRTEGSPWQALIPLSSLRGLRGFTGAKGDTGNTLDIRIDNGIIQTQYIGDEVWNDLLDTKVLLGPQGRSISNASINHEGNLIITYSDGTTHTAGSFERTHSVIFVGHHNEVLSFQSIAHGGNGHLYIPPMLEGHTFISWSRSPLNITENTLIKAIYQVNEVTLTFDVQGGTPIEDITIDYGSATTLPIPEKAGFVFKGWFLGSSVNDTKITNQTIIKDDYTLYAKWDVEIYNVIFVSGDTILTQSYVLPGHAVIPPQAPIKEGYQFTGWSSPSSSVMSNLWIEAIFEKTYVFSGVVFPEGYQAESILLAPGEEIIKLDLATERSGILTSSGRLMIWGNNTHGQLGNNTTTDSWIPVLINENFPINLVADPIVDFSLGTSHSVAVTESGRVFTWGLSTLGRLGLGNTSSRQVPTEIIDRIDLVVNEKVIKVYAGQDQTMVLTDHGNIWVWGNHNQNRLGTTSTLYSIVWPTKLSLNLNENELVDEIYLSNTFNGFLTTDGRLFMFGENTWGQLGDGTIENSQLPKLIDVTLAENEFLTKLSLGADYSVALTNQANVITWGSRFNDQIGPNRLSDNIIPTKIVLSFLNADESIIDIFAISYTTYLLTSNMRLLAFGRNDGMYFQDTPPKSSNPIDITGNVFGNEEVIVTSLKIANISNTPFIIFYNEQSLWGVGHNDKGQLGNGSTSFSAELNLTRIFNSSPNLIGNLKTGDPLPPKPNKEGYTFDGWYTDIELNIPFEDVTMPEEDITLYAKFTVNE
jgi:uncharacterized repeat protein (TIGR02543 family)